MYVYVYVWTKEWTELFSSSNGGSPCGIVVNVQECDIVVNTFEL